MNVLVNLYILIICSRDPACQMVSVPQSIIGLDAGRGGWEMPNNVDDTDSSEALLSRRAILKVMTSMPLVVSFGLFASPLMRLLETDNASRQFLSICGFTNSRQAAAIQSERLA